MIAEILVENSRGVFGGKLTCGTASVRFKLMVFCFLSMEFVHCATRMLTHTKLFILVYSNRPHFKGNKHSLRSGVANLWARPTHLNTLNKIEA